MGVSANRGEVEALIRLVGEDGVSRMVEDVQRRIARTADTTKAVAAETTNWRTSLAGARDSWASIATGMNSVLGIANAVVGAGQAAFSAWEESAKERGVELAFERAAIKAGWAADAAERLSAAVHGTVEGTQLAKIGSEAIRAGVSLEQLEGLLGVARGAARETGEEVEAVARKMVDAVAKGSVKSLREMLPDPTAALADTGDGLEGVGQRAEVVRLILEQGIPRFGELGDTAADAADRAKTAWDDFSDGMAEMFTGGGQERFAARMGAIAEQMVSAERRLADARQRLAETRPELSTQAIAEMAEYTAAQMDAEKAVDAVAKAEESRVDGQRASLAASEGKREAEAFEALQLSELAREMGLTQQAEELYVKSQKLMGFAVAEATVPLQEQLDVLVRSKAAAIENAVALAALAGAQGQGALAAELWGRAAGLLGAKPKARGGARAKAAAPKMVLGEREEAEFRSESESFDAFERDRQAEELGAEMMEGAAERKAEAAKMLAEKQDVLADSLDRVGRASLDASSAFASGFGGAAEAVARSSQIIVEQMDAVRLVLEQSEAAGGSMTAGMVKALPGMLAASGKLAGGLMGDKRAEAGVNAAFEGAAAIASFASQDYVGGALHTAAAIQYGLVAGGAIGGAGGSRGAGGGGRGRAPSLGPTPQPVQERATVVTTINMRGALVTQEGARELDRIVTRERSGRSGNPEFAVG